MPYWLAPRDAAGERSFIQRFDPRFWTVNFPRPMMASVTTTAADALRVDAVFYHADALAGLIWASDDTLDHPLLAYKTNRDYRHTQVSLHWKSDGIMPLDAINGPTLTIEGRNENGQPRTWYVRLWNYASGSPQDADIALNFSDLAGGFLHPSEADPVYAGDIDRMFISLVPPSYTNTPSVLPAPAEAYVEISDIHCDGHHAMLEIGDVLVPPHGLSMATAYDDSFNLTPERILRMVRGLGYRGDINHYVGMSHYMRLADNSGALHAGLTGGALNIPCQRWHIDLAERAKAMGHDLIFSLSYELFDAHCPDVWKQRAENGDPAQTGWVPPSALLSPAHTGAMDYLQAVGRTFTAILRDAGLPVKFQIGEPWWWVTADGRICLYDGAATAQLGTTSVSIPDVRAPLDSAQKAMLDAAGMLLASSTADLAEAVRDEAGAAGARLLLLVYLPTVLDNDAPELVRANVPTGWAKPAFDVLQLEDYDWVAQRRFAEQDRGLALIQGRLGYDTSDQHYFSGFVLNAEDSGQWHSIAESAVRAVGRGVSATFIWALPQVVRDGFTYFNIGNMEDQMQAFDDVSFPIALGREASAAPEFSTSVVTTLSGHERRNSKWANARLSYDAGPGVRSEGDLAVLMAFFRARRGAARGFRFRDPFDFSSNTEGAQHSALDQHIGTGDGVQSLFPLTKRYGIDDPQERRITRPVPQSIMIAVNGAETSDWTLTEEGEIAFAAAPAQGTVVTAGFLFDVPVRFASDRLEINSATFAAGEIPSVPLVEIREAV